MTQPTQTVHGWGAIADVLGISCRSAQRCAALPYDPLPVRITLGEPWASRARLLSWQRRYRARCAGKRDLSLPIVNVSAIRHILGRSRSAVYEYVAQIVDPLPLVQRKGERPWAYEDAVRDWFDRQDRPYQANRVERQRPKAERRQRKQGPTGRKVQPATTSLL